MMLLDKANMLYFLQTRYQSTNKTVQWSCSGGFNTLCLSSIQIHEQPLLSFLAIFPDFLFVIFYYDLLNTPSACGGVSTRKRGLGGNYVSPQVRSDLNPL